MSDGNIPHEAIRQAVLFILSQKGQTIYEIEDKRGKQYKGDESQKEYISKNVWHNKQDLDESVAIKMKLDPTLWGPDRTSNDFYKYIVSIISELRRKKQLVDWNSTSRFGIWRLTKPLVVQDPKPSLEGSIPTWNNIPQTGNSTSEKELTRSFLSILTQGSKNSTYKFALARAILDYCRQRPAGSNPYEIPYTYLSSKFLRYYWHQECKFRMKQNFTTRTLGVIQSIRDVFGNDTPGDFGLLDKDDVKNAEEKILKSVFGDVRTKTSIVVPAFQKIKEGTKAKTTFIFYEHSDAEKKIYLKPEAFEFFRKYNRLLLMAVLIEWAKFLEKINGSLPMLVSKIEDYDKKRTSLSHIRKRYLKYNNHCFYCCNKLEKNLIHVDHLIPWSYLFSDSEWNLVLACQECNCKKHSSLPQKDCMNMLIDRNYKYYDHMPTLRESLNQLNRGRGWDKEIEHHYNTCKEYGFNVIKL
jgi:hypothetical protein